MRLRTVWIGVSVLVFLAVVGCRKSEDETAGEPSMTEQAKQQAGQAMDAATKFAGETKDQFIATAQQTLDGLQQKYQQVKQQAPVKGEQAQEKLRQLQTEVETRLKTASESLAKAKEAGADAWQTAASTAKEALTSAQGAFDQLISYVKTQGQTTETMEE